MKSECNRLTDELEYVVCDLCGSKESTPYLSTYDRNWPVHMETLNDQRLKFLWSLVQCRECGLVYLNPRPTLSSLVSHYPAAYYAHAASPPLSPSRLSKLKNWLKRWVRHHRIFWNFQKRTWRQYRFNDPVEDLIGWVQPRNILDIGCGAGGFLDQLSCLGWKTFGIEISESAANEARRKGHQVYTGKLTQVDLLEHSMDVIWMSHVLEHMPSPRSTLTIVKQLLRREGVVIIQTPNLASIWARVFGEYNFSLDLPRHFYHFTPKTLTKLLVETGFLIREMRVECTPRYILYSILICLLDKEGPIFEGSNKLLEAFLTDQNLHQSLELFCHNLEQMGQGNHLLIIAQNEEKSLSTEKS